MIYEFKTNLFAQMILFFALLVLSGCSFFSSKPISNQSESSFRATAAPVANPIPVPIEVATEISEIMQGKNKKDSRTKENIPPSEPEPLNHSNSKKKHQFVSNNNKRKPSSLKSEKYQVKQGDTLMKIAFEKYGNIYRWRDIYQTNKDTIKNFNKLVSGTVLLIEGIEYVYIEKNGKAYLIKKDDSLVKISKKLYGTTANWKVLWKNNPQLITDPNKIYTGFTLYYPSINKEPIDTLRTPASRKTKTLKIGN